MNYESVVADEPRGLSQIERVVNTFVAPSAMFKDILRSASWWLPFVLMVVFSTASTYTVDRQVGFSRVAENQLHLSPKQTEQLNELPPDQQATQMHQREIGTRYFTYALPLFLLLIFAIYAGIMMASFNFGLGARMTYGQAFAVSLYASLPYLLVSLLTILTVSIGSSAETFNLQNPVGTNLAYYLPDAAPWVRALLSQIDIIKLWTVALTVLGMKIVSKKSMAQSAAVVLGWWLLIVLLSVAGAAAFS